MAISKWCTLLLVLQTNGMEGVRRRRRLCVFVCAWAWRAQHEYKWCKSNVMRNRLVLWAGWENRNQNAWILFTDHEGKCDANGLRHNWFNLQINRCVYTRAIQVNKVELFYFHSFIHSLNARHQHVSTFNWILRGISIRYVVFVILIFDNYNSFRFEFAKKNCTAPMTNRL